MRRVLSGAVLALASVQLLGACAADRGTAYRLEDAGAIDEARDIWVDLADDGDTTAALRAARLYLDDEHADRCDAVGLLTDAADQGEVRAMALLGDLYFEGECVEQDFLRARALYATAIGDLETGFVGIRLGEIYSLGLGAAVDPELAQAAYSKAAYYFANNLTSPSRYHRLGTLYRDGLGVDQDGQRAIQLFETAANGGHVPALRALGDLYASGAPGVEPRPELAYSFYSRALELGEWQVYPALIDMVMAGNGTTADPVRAEALRAQAVERLTALAQGGDTRAARLLVRIARGSPALQDDTATVLAQLQSDVGPADADSLDLLGDSYFFGTGVERDIDRALDYYLQAAADGSRNRLNRIAMIYDSVESRHHDPSIANQYWAMDAEILRGLSEQGQPSAMVSLANMYRRGQGLPTDGAAARSLYERAAALGSADAMTRLGDLYRTGAPGLPADTHMAVQWYEAAIEGGDLWGAVDLAKLYLGGRGVRSDQARARHLFGRAADWLEQQARAGDGRAAFELAELYERGWGVGPSLEQARLWYVRADELGEARAAERL